MRDVSNEYADCPCGHIGEQTEQHVAKGVELDLGFGTQDVELRLTRERAQCGGIARTSRGAEHDEQPECGERQQPPIAEPIRARPMRTEAMRPLPEQCAVPVRGEGEQHAEDDGRPRGDGRDLREQEESVVVDEPLGDADAAERDDIERIVAPGGRDALIVLGELRLVATLGALVAPLGLDVFDVGLEPLLAAADLVLASHLKVGNLRIQPVHRLDVLHVRHEQAIERSARLAPPGEYPLAACSACSRIPAVSPRGSTATRPKAASSRACSWITSSGRTASPARAVGKATVR